MLLNKIKSRQLTTWRTKACLSCFPYGSSPWPPIATFIFTQTPSVILTIYLFTQAYLILASYLIVVQLIIFIAMIKVLTTNPGILPQITYRCETDEELFEVPSRQPRLEHRYLLPQRNLLPHQKYCDECHIYRPIRSIHCSACNHCVERYDHHCPWLSICIGKYNYKYFLAYIIGLMILIISCFAVGLAYTIIISSNPQSVVGDFIVYMLVGLFAFIFMFPIGRLLLYHFQLIYKGITTNEQIKKTYKIINNELPFEKLEYSIYREKRLPKYSYRLQKIKKPESVKVNLTSDYYSVQSQKRSSEQEKSERVSIFNSLIQNQDL